MAKLTRKLINDRDLTRRWTRRGVARAVLEHKGNPQYMDTHPIAAEMANTYSTKRVEQWAGEKQIAVNGGGTKTFGMEIDATNPKAAVWP